MGRKNRRNKKDYQQRLGFNPYKYAKQSEYSKKKATFGKSYRNIYSVSKYIPERPYRVPYRGEIWVAQLGSHPNTSVQEGCRPVLIVSNDKGNHTSLSVPGGDRAEIKQKDPTKKGWGVLGQRTAENCKKSFGRYLAKPALKNPKGRGIFERKEPSGSENQH